MKTLVITLALLILAVAIQNAYGRPPRRNRGDEGQHPQGQRRQGQGRPEREGQGGQRGPFGGRGRQGRGPRNGHRGRMGPKPCLLMNVTNSNEVLCNHTCPSFAECVAPPTPETGRPEGAAPPFPESLEVHFCLPKVCGPDNACPNGSICQTLGQEMRCFPDKPTRGRRDSSEESEESDEDLDEDMESSEEDEEDDKRCIEVLREIVHNEMEGKRGEGRRPSREGQGGRRENVPMDEEPIPQFDGLFGEDNGGFVNGRPQYRRNFQGRRNSQGRPNNQGRPNTQGGPGRQGRRPRNGHRGRMGLKPCLLMNVTNGNEVLCNHTCPSFAECVSPPRPETDRPEVPFQGSLEVHFCLPKVCGPDNACPNGSICQTLGQEMRCFPDKPTRGRRDSSEESEESEEDLEEDMESSEEDEENEKCMEVLREIVHNEMEGKRGEGRRPSREGRGGPSQGGRRENVPMDEEPIPQFDGLFGEDNGGFVNGLNFQGKLNTQGRPSTQGGQGRERRGLRNGRRDRFGPKPCLLINVTNSNEVLCNHTCPSFAECVAPPTPETGRPETPFPESLEVHFCLPKVCGPDNACPNGSICQTFGQEMRCFPNKSTRGRRDSSEESEESDEDMDEDMESSEEDEEEEKCIEVLREIVHNEMEGERGEGRRPSREGQGGPSEGGRRENVPMDEEPTPQGRRNFQHRRNSQDRPNTQGRPNPRDIRPFRQAPKP